MSETVTETTEAHEAQYVRVRDRSVTIQLKDGTCAAAEVGSVWSTEQMRDTYVEQLATDGSWTANQFDPATKEEFDRYAEDTRVFEQKDFMRDHLGEFAHVGLPQPDAPGDLLVEVREAGNPPLDPERKAPIIKPGADVSDDSTSEDEDEDGTTDEDD